MTEYNSFNFDQNPWAFSPANPPGQQQSPTFHSYSTDGLGMLDQGNGGVAGAGAGAAGAGAGGGQSPGTANSNSWSSWFPHPTTSSSNSNTGGVASGTAGSSQQKSSHNPALHRQGEGSPQEAPPQLESNATNASTNSTTPATTTAATTNSFLPQHRASPFQPESETRNAFKSLADQTQPAASSSPAVSHTAPPPPSGSSVPSAASATPVNNQPPNLALHHFLTGYNPAQSAPSAYVPPISQEDYIRLLKQAAVQQQHATNSMFGFAPPPPSASSPSQPPRPSSASSSSHAHSHPHSHPHAHSLYPPPNSASTTFSLPPPAQYGGQSQAGGHSSRPHERTPSASSSIRTSSNDRVGGGGGSVLDSPRGSYPTYPSPQQQQQPPPNTNHPLSQNPYLSHLASHPHAGNSNGSGNGHGNSQMTGGETGGPGNGGYNPSEPYIALHHPFPSHLLVGGGPGSGGNNVNSGSSNNTSAVGGGVGNNGVGASLDSSPPSPLHYSPSQQQARTSGGGGLQFAPPAPPRANSGNAAPTAYQPTGLSHLHHQHPFDQRDFHGHPHQLPHQPLHHSQGTLHVNNAVYGSDSNAGANGKGKGKMVEGTSTIPTAPAIGTGSGGHAAGGIGFVPPKKPSSANGRGGSASGSSTKTGAKSGRRKRSHGSGDDGEEGPEGQDDEDIEDYNALGVDGGDDELGNSASSAFTRQPVASGSNNQAGGRGSVGPGGVILPNTIDPITGQLRRQTEVPAVEDDPSVRPYGCNYCFLDRTVDPSIRAYWEQQERMNDGYKVSWRTVKELREHNQSQHRERTERMKEHEQMLKDEGNISNGKGPDLPFRCALEPCGKTFKSLAGLRFHFQNASANGHFFVSVEKDHKTGEERALKKFKQDIQPNGRELSCPVDRCPKRFKQSAGLAYHLSHTPNHEVTEAMVATFENTLQSKTRWWFRKLGLEFAR